MQPDLNSADAVVPDLARLESRGAGLPTPDEGRIGSLDVLRGFAVLGILVMNIQSFAMPEDAYSIPTRYGSLEGLNYAVWFASHVLADEKFMSIFSILFGAGIVLFTDRRAAAGQSPAALHFRRNGVLFGFGLLHAYLLWYGDILTAYAMCACVVFFLRKLRPLPLLLLAAGFLVGGAVIWAVGFDLLPTAIQDAGRAFIQPCTIPEELASYRGPWWGQMAHRVPAAFAAQTLAFALYTACQVSGLMLLGMALLKLGVLSAARSRFFYVALAGLGVVSGVPLILVGVREDFAHDWDVNYLNHFGFLFNYWGALAMALAYIALVMLACRAAWLKPVSRVFAAAGRMALTNYLLQTVICTTLFYGHGLGWFGYVSRTGQVLIVVAVWAIELTLSAIWLRYFRFGPTEWLWRSLTYWRVQPFLRGSAGGGWGSGGG